MVRLAPAGAGLRRARLRRIASGGWLVGTHFGCLRHLLVQMYSLHTIGIGAGGD